ncbi:RNA-protein complex protein Nop10 [Methanohalophilus sp.]
MGKKILKCISCGEYTLQETCPKCGKKTIKPSPARYSPRDPYGKYRRLSKRN